VRATKILSCLPFFLLVHVLCRFLNIRLDAIEVADQARHPHMVCSIQFDLEIFYLLSPPFQMAVKNCFIRGSVVRYVQLPAEHVDTQLLEDATRRGEFPCAMNGREKCLIAILSLTEAATQGKR
jgi:hypothetical protein